MRLAPSFGFRLENRVIVRHISVERNIPIKNDGARLFRGDLVHQPLTHSRVGGFDIGWIGEPLISVGDECQRIGKFDPERRPRLAEQLVSRKIDGVLREQQCWEQ